MGIRSRFNELREQGKKEAEERARIAPEETKVLNGFIEWGSLGVSIMVVATLAICIAGLGSSMQWMLMIFAIAICSITFSAFTVFWIAERRVKLARYSDARMTR